MVLNRNSWIIFILLLINSLSGNDATKNNYFQYIFPKPGSHHISKETTIFFRLNEYWKKYLNLNSVHIMVEGNVSGIHTGKTIVADDHETVIFKPFQKFADREKVNIELTLNLKGREVSKKYSFHISKFESNNPLYIDQQEEMEYLKLGISISGVKPIGNSAVINNVSVPWDFPMLDIAVQTNPSPGKIFLGTWLEYPYPYVMIFNNDGTPFYYERLKEWSIDFKMQPGGTLTRWEYESLDAFIEIDTNYVVVDTLRCGHGYATDMHDVLILPNGNYLIIALVYEIIDMSQLISGGNPNALVRGSHVLEMDRDDNVIFEWQCWDHFEILDAVDQNFTSSSIDYVHMNAIAVDYDGQFVTSSRSLSEITKINRQTGEIIWRLGGKNNQFEFVNDEYGISRQHDIRPVPGKENHYTLFDNGSHHNPPFSRAVEFVLDTTQMTATKVWEYRCNPDRYTVRGGNVQRLQNGNTIINWVNGDYPKVTEVTADGEVVYEMNFDSAVDSYRSFRFEWEGVKKVPYLLVDSHTDRVSLIFNKFGDTNVTAYVVYADQSPEPETAIDTTMSAWLDLVDLENNTTYYFRVTVLDSAGIESDFSNEEEIFVKYVESGENIILNGEFAESDDYWHLEISNGAIADSSLDNGYYHLKIENGGIRYEDIQLIQTGLVLTQGKKYKLEFDGWADTNRLIDIKLENSISPNEDYGKIGLLDLRTELSHYNFDFEMESYSDLNTRIVFNSGNNRSDIYIDNVSLKEIIASDIKYNKENYLPETYKLFQNYPNPFNPQTLIRYAVPNKSFVKIETFNVLGQKVNELVNSFLEPGLHQVIFNSTNISSGIYFYRMEARTLTGKILYNEIQKMILLK